MVQDTGRTLAFTGVVLVVVFTFAPLARDTAITALACSVLFIAVGLVVYLIGRLVDR